MCFRRGSWRRARRSVAIIGIGVRGFEVIGRGRCRNGHGGPNWKPSNAGPDGVVMTALWPDSWRALLLVAKYGVPTVVAKVRRLDWLRNAVGLLDLNYWRGTLQPTHVLDWYWKRIHDTVQEARELAQGNLNKEIECKQQTPIN